MKYLKKINDIIPNSHIKTFESTTQDLDLIYRLSKNAPKPGDGVWVRDSDCNRWESSIFISGEIDGFKVYKYCVKKPEYIDYFPELTTKDPYYSKVHIFRTDDLDCPINPFYNIWKLFMDHSKMELFNEYDIIRGDSVILDRLNDFLIEIGKQPVEKVDWYKNI